MITAITPKKIISKRLDTIKNIPLSELYQGKLKQSGNHLTGLCPMHKESNPSFVIYPKNNSWYCFTCGIGGSNIDYLMKLYDISFSEAVERLEVVR